MNRRDFLKKLGTLAAAGALAPAVTELLTATPVESETFDRRFGAVEFEVPANTFKWSNPDDANPLDDLRNAIERLKKDAVRIEPTGIMISAGAWAILVNALGEHHPELAAEARMAS